MVSHIATPPGPWISKTGPLEKGSRALKSTAIVLRPPSAAIDPRMHWLMAGVRDLMAMQSIDDAASCDLFHALNEIPLRVTEEARERGVAMPRAAEVADVVGALQGMLRDHVRDARSGQFARVQDVLAAVSREVGPAKLIALAPAALCDACGFDRALISRIDGSSWVPGVLHIATGASDGAGTGLAEYLA